MATHVLHARSGQLALVALSLFACQMDATTETQVAAARPEPLAQVMSRAADGRARMLLGAAVSTAGSTSSAEAARAHVLRHAALLGLDAELDPQRLPLADRALAGGARLVSLGQRAHGLPVFGAHARVLMDAQRQLVSLASSLAATGGSEPPQFQLTPEHAVLRAYAAHGGVRLPADAAMPLPDAPGECAAYRLATPAGAPAAEVATVRRVLFPVGEGLRPAYHVELLLRGPGGSNQGFGRVLDADSGEALWSASLTASEVFQYRVWADPNGLHAPSDGPLADATPYPGAAPDRQRPGTAAPVLIAMEGFNKNPSGAADPWLAPDAKTTLGNNVTAYTDRNATVDSLGRQRNDGFNQGVDVRGQLTGERTFDHSFDLSRAPNADDAQLQAAVTQIFYTTNWLHDYFYDSGFDEAAGNAQQSNFGRGGAGGDPLRAEAQDSADSGAANNANMTVLGDGISPRMQMYVWNGLPNRALATEPALALEDELGSASYGPQTFDLTAELVLVNDGSTAVSSDGTPPGRVTDGCQRLRAADVQGRIAVMERGGCTFISKLKNAQQAGAKAVLVLDNTPGHNAVNPSTDDPPSVDIPLLALSYEDGQKLKQALGSAPLTATRFFRGAETQRDGTIDNTVVAHEWGHYLHHRLVQCASASCDGMSEGWADFIALMLVIRDGDTFDGQVFPLSQYASGGLNQSSAYYGIRRAPYSTDMSKNPFTFKHVRAASQLPTGAPLSSSSPELNEAHNVGEIWAEMLFEAYASLLKAGQAAGRPFEETRRRMADYIVAGMQAAPPEPTFVEQRDAILLSVQAMARQDSSRRDDLEALAAGFAKRGLGAGAVAPPTSSRTLNEAVESFSTELSVSLGGAQPPAAISGEAVPVRSLSSLLTPGR